MLSLFGEFPRIQNQVVLIILQLGNSVGRGNSHHLYIQQMREQGMKQKMDVSPGFLLVLPRQIKRFLGELMCSTARDSKGESLVMASG